MSVILRPACVDTLPLIRFGAVYVAGHRITAVYKAVEIC
jgi:hypothetical protein